MACRLRGRWRRHLTAAVQIVYGRFELTYLVKLHVEVLVDKTMHQMILVFLGAAPLP